MLTRRNFLQKSLTTAGVIAVPLVGLGTAHAAGADTKNTKTNLGRQLAQTDAPAIAMEPPPDLFDAQVLDLEFWVKPRTLTVTRPQSGERASVLYWKDGEIIDAAYQELCHLMRDVNGKETAPIDPKLFETLWGTQAFIARYGIDQPLEILSGYRTEKSNQNLIEQGVPAARQSLHTKGKAADIRIANLNAEVLGSLVRSFRQGGVGYYYRAGPRGGWIHADTGLQRTWKG